MIINMSLNLITTLLVIILLSSSFLTISAFPSDFVPRFFPNASSLPQANLTFAWQSLHNLTGCRSGDSRAGLAKLKKYFQQFGYLNNYQNLTDDFDNSLESALKTYQRNFNLNTTGELDQTTLNQILSPRCGVADIVNGTSSMNSGKAPASSPLHVVAHYTHFPGSPRWPTGQDQLTYSFAPENELNDNVKAIFRAAFDRWSEVTTLTFLQTDAYGAADIKIGFYSGDHGDGEAFDGVLGTLAHAFSPPSGRLHLDNDENWVINADDLRSASAVDLESVVVHEIGHLLGLGHSSVEDAVMFPSIPSGAKKIQLAGDDVAGIQSLYDPNPAYVPGSNPSGAQENETSDGGFAGPVWGHMIVLAVGLFLYVL